MKFLSFLALTFGAATAQMAPMAPNVEPVEYSDQYDNDFPLMGYVSIPESETPVPAVVIIVSRIYSFFFFWLALLASALMV